MIRIAIIEDDKDQAATLESHIKRYAEEHKEAISVTVFYNVITFLEKYKSDYEIVYMDIMMPMMNGMDAARLLRKKDERVLLVFVTSMRQYAVQGYEVTASDFIVKPVKYPEFSLKFTRLLDKVTPAAGTDIILKSESGFVRLTPAQILYVEVSAHHCVYHTKLGEYRQYQSMKSVETLLADQGFARCSNFLLVNLAYVTKVDGMSVYLGDTECAMSHPRKKAFLEALSAYTETLHYD